MEHTIDASGKKIGRVASEAAVLLRGKDTPAFERNVAPSVTVRIVNASKVSVTAAKLKNKNYKRYSGYPGGLKHTTMERTVEKKGYEEVFKKAVYGMLPANKLRPIFMKNLMVTE